MFYSPFFRHVRAVSGLGGHVLGTLGEEPLFKAGVSSLPSHEYLSSLCVCVMKEVPSLFCPVQKDVT